VCLELEHALWRQSLLLCADQALAEDLVQEALIIAWRRLESFDGSSRILTWVTGILLNLHRNFARKKQLVLESELKGTDTHADEPPGALMLDLVDPAHGPADSLLMSERNSLLRKCLGRLSDDQRGVVHLRFFVGADLGEIATALGCPEGTVKSRLFHAIRKLAAMEDLRETIFGTNLEKLL
jgi:RNA polymerase sigma-70 factor (ECF subfamily)